MCRLIFRSGTNLDATGEPSQSPHHAFRSGEALPYEQDWNKSTNAADASGSTVTDSRVYALSPNQQHPSAQITRDLLVFPADFDWKETTGAPDRSGDLHNALEPNAVHPANGFGREFENLPPEFDWKVGTQPRDVTATGVFASDCSVGRHVGESICFVSLVDIRLSSELFWKCPYFGFKFP